ncbi:MAG: amidase family protein [Verrucomicrobiota bacterium]
MSLPIPESISAWRHAIQSNPEQAVDALLRGIESLPQNLHRSVIRWTPERSAFIKAITDSASAAGPLSGVPYALKDLFDFAGAPTTAGSSFLNEVRETPTKDSHMVESLAHHGAVMASKVATVEFAYGLSGENQWYGDCPHPSVSGALSGGSSSGSAWVVARGLVPFAIGTDTAGSVRVPAAYCGLFGWRDIPGPFVQEGCVPLAQSYDTPGWFTRSAAELQMLNELLLPHVPDSTNLHVLDLSSLASGMDDQLLARGQGVLQSLEAVEDPVALGHAQEAFADVATAYNILSTLEIFANHQDWIDAYRDRYDPVVWARIDRGRHWTAEQVGWATEKQRRVRETFAQLFARYDAIALPITPIPSPGKGAMTEDYRSALLALNTPASLACVPALTIPIKLEDGRSGGLQILFAAEEDRTWKASRILERLETL